LLTTVPNTSGKVVIDMRRITKAFSGVRVLQDVDFDLREGEVHALVGGNGAGKSTLMKILEGVHPPDAGEIVIDGRTVRLNSSLDGRTHGIAMIFQEFSLISTLTVSQNIFLTHEARSMFGLLNDKECERATRKLFSEIGVEVDPRLPVSALSTGQCQLTEIVKALSQNARALIMDEPTASLAKSETDSLFHIIAQLKARGIGIVYISHRMEEIFRIADRVTILRDGKVVATEAIADLTFERMIEHIVGRNVGQSFQWLPRTVVRSGTPLLELSGVVSGERVKQISLKVFEGEVVGLVGLMGSGRTELLQSIFGIRPITAGEIRIRGRRIPIRSPKDAMTARIVLIPEDRRSQGLVMDHALKDNILLPLLDKFTRNGIIREAAAQRKVEEYVKKLNIRSDSIFKIVRELSGGNQQKVVIAKWLGAEPDIFLMDEPTAGVDIGAKGEIIALIRQLAGDLGKAVLLVSSELPELLAVSDRILFMRGGRVESEKERSDIESEAALHHLIQGN
jgi:ribose transport system ATP-binding protein